MEQNAGNDVPGQFTPKKKYNEQPETVVAFGRTQIKQSTDEQISRKYKEYSSLETNNLQNDGMRLSKLLSNINGSECDKDLFQKKKFQQGFGNKNNVNASKCYIKFCLDVKSKEETSLYRKGSSIKSNKRQKKGKISKQSSSRYIVIKSPAHATKNIIQVNKNSEVIRPTSKITSANSPVDRKLLMKILKDNIENFITSKSPLLMDRTESIFEGEGENGYSKDWKKEKPNYDDAAKMVYLKTLVDNAKYLEGIQREQLNNFNESDMGDSGNINTHRNLFNDSYQYNSWSKETEKGIYTFLNERSRRNLFESNIYECDGENVKTSQTEKSMSKNKRHKCKKGGTHGPIFQEEHENTWRIKSSKCGHQRGNAHIKRVAHHRKVSQQLESVPNKNEYTFEIKPCLRMHNQRENNTYNRKWKQTEEYKNDLVELKNSHEPNNEKLRKRRDSIEKVSSDPQVCIPKDKMLILDSSFETDDSLEVSFKSEEEGGFKIIPAKVVMSCGKITHQPLSEKYQLKLKKSCSESNVEVRKPQRAPKAENTCISFTRENGSRRLTEDIYECCPTSSENLQVTHYIKSWKNSNLSEEPHVKLVRKYKLDTNWLVNKISMESLAVKKKSLQVNLFRKNSEQRNIRKEVAFEQRSPCIKNGIYSKHTNQGVVKVTCDKAIMCEIIQNKNNKRERKENLTEQVCKYDLVKNVRKLCLWSRGTAMDPSKCILDTGMEDSLRDSVVIFNNSKSIQNIKKKFEDKFNNSSKNNKWNSALPSRSVWNFFRFKKGRKLVQIK